MTQSLPPGWNLARISDLTSSSVSKEGPGSAADFTYIDIGAVDNKVKRITGATTLPVSKAPSRARQRLESGDVLVSTVRPNLNAVALVPPSLDGSIGSTGFHVLRVRAALPEWLFYFVQTDDFVGAMSGRVAGVVYPAIRPKDLLSYEVPVAPLLEQRRIVEAIEVHFTRLDAAVAALRRVSANLKRYKASALKAAVEGKIVETEAAAAGRTGTPFENGQALLGRILREPPQAGRKAKAEAKFEQPAHAGLPNGWAWARIKQVGDVQLGRQRAPKHHAGTHMRPYLRVANVFEDRIDLSDVNEMNFTPEEFEKYKLSLGDILLNEGQTPELVGRPAMVRTELPGYCFQNTLVRFRAYPGVLPAYALAVFRAYVQSQRFKRIAQITTNIAHLGAERFSEVEFPLPPLAEQRRIVQEVERRLSVGDAVAAEVHAGLKRCASLRQGLLKQAFGGRLVPQDPKDEPAILMLKRMNGSVPVAPSPNLSRKARGVQVQPFSRGDT